MTSRAAPIGLLLLLLVSGCGGEASPLGWTINFENPDDLTGTAVVTTTVIEGGCDSGGSIVYRGSITLPDGSAPAPMNELGSGTYGFRVEARSNACTTISQTCKDYDLPLDQATITSTLPTGSMDGTGCLPGTRCDGAGNCEPIPMGDGGMMVPCEMENSACDDGMGVTGVCHGGSCCFGCWDGSECQTGTTPSACGSAGGMCASCDPGDSCQGSSCMGTSSGADFALSPRAVFYKHTNGSYWANGDDEQYQQLGPVAAAGNFLRGYTGSLQFVDIAAAETATAGIEEGTGALYTWGTNGVGILGSGSTNFDEVVTAPTHVDTTRAYRQVSGVSSFFCAIQTNGSLYCWGGGTSGQLGSPSTFQSTPTRVGDSKWIMVDAGFEHACGIRDDRALFCWGKGESGRLGDGATIDRTSPSRVGTDNDWVEVSAGQGHTCGIRVVSGQRKLYCWGRTTSGVLGIGDPGMVMEMPTPQQVGAGDLIENGWVHISAGSYDTCGLIDRGMGDGVEAYCWGFTGFGAHGGGSTMMATVLSPAPVALGSNTGWTSITAGFQQSCGVASGTPYCWGDSRLMMDIDKTWLGVGATDSVATPTEVIFSPALP